MARLFCFYELMSQSISIVTGKTRQKDVELKWFNLFQRKIPDCPRSRPVQPLPPAPDLIFSDCDLGIEITEYSLGQGKQGSHPRRIESVHRTIVREAQRGYESCIKHCLQVSVLWANAECPTKREEKTLAQSITGLVLSRTGQKQKMWRIEWEKFDNLTLQKFVARISIYVIGDEGPSCWASAASIWAWEANKRVRIALDQKEPKVWQYKRFCSEIWLLIVANREWLSSHYFYDPMLEKVKFHSSFDRAFVLDEVSAVVREIKLSLPL